MALLELLQLLREPLGRLPIVLFYIFSISLQDCYAVLPDFSDNSILLGVFDGHGGENRVGLKLRKIKNLATPLFSFNSFYLIFQGREVAEYCKAHIEMFLKESKHYNDNIPMAFKEAYVACDKALLSSEGQKELKRIIADTNNHSTEEEEDTFGDTERLDGRPLLFI